jgi:hypothetical protein
MTGSTLGFILIPVVVAVCLAIWISSVFHAERKPGPGRPTKATDRDVTGGIFRGDPRQQMPHRDATAVDYTDEARSRSLGEESDAGEKAQAGRRESRSEESD